MNRPRRPVRALVLTAASLAVATTAMAQSPVRLAGAACERPPVHRCPEEGCVGDALALVTEGGPVTEPATGRNFFLDYPCDLEPGEEVTFVLSLHGMGSFGNWQRHYFPLVDYVDRYRLVVATPYSPRQAWSTEDDDYLRNVSSLVIDEVGAANIRAFWLAGHSQGGLTSRRLICTDFFREKVDGLLSLSGGRTGGQAPVSFAPPPLPGAAGRGGGPPAAGRGAGPGGGPPAGGRGGAGLAAAAEPDCDFSHVYTTGEHELVDGLAGLPRTSSLAERFGCGPRAQRGDVVDTRGGNVHDSRRQENPTLSWGRTPGPGRAEVYVFPGCEDGRIVADVVRIDKGHTEGLEPAVTEELVRMMVWAPGGKLRQER